MRIANYAAYGSLTSVLWRVSIGPSVPRLGVRVQKAFCPVALWVVKSPMVTSAAGGSQEVMTWTCCPE
eukprot:COSAG02_NODE_660_length_18763_cov_116.476425_5_plen_68_part_00